MVQPPSPVIYVGVDTHRDRHHAAILDAAGHEVAERAFPATGAGYEELADWATSHGTVMGAAVEGTSSYGAGLTRVLLAAGWQVYETTPGDKADRRLRGKSDAVDAFTAARAALSGRAHAAPKTGDGPAEQARILQVSRRLLVTQQTQLMNQIKSLIITCPEDLREQWRGLSAIRLAQALAATDPAGSADPITATTLEVLADSARRWHDLRQRTNDLARQISALLHQHAPALLAVAGVGPDVAARLLAAVGDNPARIRSEAAMAHLFGIAPIPASSGNTTRHRLDRGGNRSANCAVHRIALVRMSHDPATRDYITRCTARGKTKKEALRLLKRAIIRELYPVLTQ